MRRGRAALKDISFYSTAILLTQVITMAASILTRKFLGPTQMGVWAFLQALLMYAEYSALGTTTAITFEIPFYSGQGDQEKVRRVTNAGFSFALITAFAVSICAVFYACFRRTVLRQELFYGFLIGAGFVILQRFNNFFILVVRAKKQFDIAGRQMLYSSILNASLIALLSYRYRIYGFLAAMALSLLFNIIYLSWRARLSFRFVADWKGMGALVRYGVPLMAVGFLGTIFETLDRFFITHFLGFESLGFYSIALMVVNFMNGVPNSVGVVTVSHLQEKYGEAGSTAALRGYLKKVDTGYGLLMALLIGGAWLVVPWLVRLILPEYVSGISALKFLALGTYFMALAQGYSQFVYVIRKHRVLLLLLPISCLSATAADWVAMKQGYGVFGIAGATSFGMFIHFSLISLYAFSRVFTWKESLLNYGAVIVKFLFILGLLLIIERWIYSRNVAVSACVQIIVYGIGCAPLAVLAEKNFGMVSAFRSKFAGR